MIFQQETLSYFKHRYCPGVPYIYMRRLCVSISLRLICTWTSVHEAHADTYIYFANTSVSVRQHGREMTVEWHEICNSSSFSFGYKHATDIHLFVISPFFQPSPFVTLRYSPRQYSFQRTHARYLRKKILVNTRTFTNELHLRIEYFLRCTRLFCGYVHEHACKRRRKNDYYNY